MTGHKYPLKECKSTTDWCLSAFALPSSKSIMVIAAMISFFSSNSTTRAESIAIIFDKIYELDGFRFPSSGFIVQGHDFHRNRSLSVRLDTGEDDYLAFAQMDTELFYFIQENCKPRAIANQLFVKNSLCHATFDVELEVAEFSHTGFAPQVKLHLKNIDFSQ